MFFDRTRIFCLLFLLKLLGSSLFLTIWPPLLDVQLYLWVSSLVITIGTSLNLRPRFLGVLFTCQLFLAFALGQPFS